MGALDGVRVLDFGQHLAGPLLAMMLADHGADVIRVDPPGGPLWRHPANAALQRGKRSIVLDLKSPEGLGEARGLVENCDVLVENFRPGVMARLGLGPAELTRRHPRLIYCSLPGFAADDPRARIPAYEAVVGAAAGVYGLPHFLPPSEQHPADVPIFSALPLASSFAAFAAAHSVLAALIARHRTGRGQAIEVPLYDAVFWIAASKLFVRTGEPGFAILPDDMVRLLPVFGNHQCKDGRWIFVSPPLRGVRALAERFLQPLPPHGADAEEMAAFRSRIDAQFRSRSAAEWEDAAQQEVGAGVAVCQTTEEWMEDPHARQSGCVIPLEDHELGTTWQIGYPIALSRTPPRARGSRRPLGADQGASFTGPRIADRPQIEPLTSALAGVRVIDTTQIAAGPTAGRILAEYGAEVIKINDPRPDANPTGAAVHGFLNAGKRTMLLNLASEQGLEVLRRLLAGADVFHQNFVRGAAERMGFGEPALREIRPDIIYSSLNTHAEGGFRTFYRGHEELGQAVTGIQERYGDRPKPETHSGWTLCDFGAGHLSAFAILLALFHRLRTGEGQHVSASLSGTGGYYQVPFALSFAGRERTEPRGLYAKGWNALDRFYKASDRWFYMTAGRPESRERLLSLAGLAADAEGVEDVLAARLATEPAATWVERLTAAGVGAHVAAERTDVLTDEVALRRGLVLRWEEDGLEVRSLGVVNRLSLTPARPGRAAPLGAHGADILTELGLAEKLDELVARGVLAIPPAPDKTHEDMR